MRLLLLLLRLLVLLRLLLLLIQRYFNIDEFGYMHVTHMIIYSFVCTELFFLRVCQVFTIAVVMVVVCATVCLPVAAICLIFLQYKELYQSKIRDLCHRLKQQQHNFSAQEKILHQKAEQVIFPSVCNSHSNFGRY